MRMLLVLTLGGCAVAPPSTDALRAPVLDALAASGGEWGVYYRDLQTGAELAIRADEEFHPASTLKIWVMIKVFQDARDGKYSLDDEVPVAGSFLSAARKDPRPFEVKAYAPAVAEAVGRRMKVRELVEHMITVSDNLATNNLIALAGGPEAINACLATCGIVRSNVRRFIMDQQAFDEGLSSVAVPRDFGEIFAKLDRGEVVSPEASRGMLAVLGRVKDGSMLPAGLPAGTRVEHKTGEIEGVRNDAGRVTLPDGRRYVAAFFSRGQKDGKKAAAALAAASRLLHGFSAR